MGDGWMEREEGRMEERGSVKREDEKKEKRGNGGTLYLRPLPN